VLVAAIDWEEFARIPPPRYGDLLLPGVALLATWVFDRVIWCHYRAAR
jgi:hypothetical protein